MNTLNLKLEGLDCPNCAEKIRSRVEKLDKVSSANMNFMSKKLTVSHNSVDKEILPKIREIVKSLEPDVEVTEFKNEPVIQEENHTFDIARLSVAAVLFLVSFFVKAEIPNAILATAAYIIAGYDVIISAFKNIIKGEAFDESLLMTIATFGALALKDFSEGAAVMLFFQVGELFQDIAVERSRKSITKLMELKPESAGVYRDGVIVEVPPEEVKIGDVIAVKTGERIPLDGVICEGNSSLDCSALTGESIPVEVSEGTEVLSGSTNLKGMLKIKVTSEFKNSAVAKILDMVQNSTEKKATTEKFITRFARVYTPAVVGAAALLVILPTLIIGLSSGFSMALFTKWLYRGLLFLVISCPCALVISVPLSFFSGIGRASSKGILIKGAKGLELLAKCKTLAVDKTGTLTKGKFAVLEINPESDVISRDKLLEYAAYCESGSTHPIGVSICAEYRKEISQERISDLSETAGNGISCRIDGKSVLCGKKDLLEKGGISIPSDNSGFTTVYLSVDGVYAGKILLGDEVRETSADAVQSLKKQGIETVMLTGDKKSAAESTAKQLGISDYYSELLPENKVEKIEELLSDESRRLVAFAGDGINDAPVIARADIGIAMGGLGSDIAIEAADVVLMNDDPKSISLAVEIAGKTLKIVHENIIFSLSIKALIMILGAFGIAGMWAAVFADVGVAVIAILNSLRS